MEYWTLVYRVHRNSLASRRRVAVRYWDATRAYDMFLLAQQPKREPMRLPEVVSHACIIRPDGEKIPLLSGVPPHHAISRERFMQAVTQRGLIPTGREHRSVDREILHRRLERALLPALNISENALKVLGHIDNALFWGSEHKLATVCERVLGPLGSSPRECPRDREPLRRRLHGLAKQAQSGFPAIALVLTYLEHAFARGTEERVLVACKQVSSELFTGRILGRRDDTEPAKEPVP